MVDSTRGETAAHMAMVAAAARPCKAARSAAAPKFAMQAGLTIDVDYPKRLRHAQPAAIHITLRTAAARGADTAIVELDETYVAYFRDITAIPLPTHGRITIVPLRGETPRQDDVAPM